MKASIKLAVIGLALVGGAAHAAVINSSVSDASGSSLVLLLQNSSTNEYINYELTPKVLDFNSRAYLQSQDDFKYSLDGIAATGSMTVSASLNGWSDASLTSYLTSHTGQNITWTVLGGDWKPSIATAANQNFLLTSTADQLNAYWSTGNVYTAAQLFGQVITGINNNTAAGSHVNTAYGYGSPGQGAGIPGSLGGPAGNGAALGVGQSLWLLAAASDQSFGANNYKSAGLLTLSSTGVLSYNGSDIAAPAVPVPAAAWLFGSGLMGLVGIARRRNRAA